jgi:BirA family biotin operon repressor/biotin-[acetyl-CoA-carboxylase] ligase
VTELDRWSAAADPRRRVGRIVEHHAQIGSTNDRAWQLLRDGLDGAAVVADLQTAGRGRHGRVWASPPDLNLMVSVGVRVSLPAADSWQLGAASALAVREACRLTLHPAERGQIGLKWPNDVVEGFGRKLAGLLIETAVTGQRVNQAVIGAGINVNWPRASMPEDIAPRASSLLELARGPVDRVALLRVYLAALDAEIIALEAGMSPLARYRAASWLDGRGVEVEAGERHLAGRAGGIGEDGSLVVETASGRDAVRWGEVIHVALDDMAGAPR